MYLWVRTFTTSPNIWEKNIQAWGMTYHQHLQRNPSSSMGRPTTTEDQELTKLINSVPQNMNYKCAIKRKESNWNWKWTWNVKDNYKWMMPSWRTLCHIIIQYIQLNYKLPSTIHKKANLNAFWDCQVNGIFMLSDTCGWTFDVEVNRHAMVNI